MSGLCATNNVICYLHKYWTAISKFHFDIKNGAFVLKPREVHKHIETYEWHDLLDVPCDKYFVFNSERPLLSFCSLAIIRNL
jgi:hypothetical protein